MSNQNLLPNQMLIHVYSYSLLAILCLATAQNAFTQPAKRPREYGIRFGVIPTGPLNAITDVPGVRVGQVTLQQGQRVRTGVTAIVPHPGNQFQQKSPAAIYIGNGFGKLSGYSQVEELGTLETPIILTNTLSVPTAADALIDYTLTQAGNEKVRSVNAVVGETNDGFLNDIRGRHVEKKHVLEAIQQAKIGGIASNGSGDYVIAVSTAYTIPHETGSAFDELKLLRNDNISPLFMAAIEAIEEAIINSLFAAKTMTGDQGHRVDELPKQRVIDWLMKK
ncbi:MAG: P1 family peptidase [Rudanella sp.]|nr:P1 family peptidase [Rudanella sp.]